MKYFNIMESACDNEGVVFNEEKYNKFMKYKNLIKEWNEKINLTAITEDGEIVKKHFIDSIKIFRFPFLKNAKNIIDIGTGAGFPGIPIKIINEEICVVLLDSLNKRINFLNEVIDRLDLKNIKTIHGRAEDYAKNIEYREKFDIATSRAVANMTVLSEFCIPYVKVGGYFVALKGPSIEEEILESKNAIGTLGGRLEDIIKVDIEESDLKHNLVIVKKIKQTPKQFPRKSGIVTKKPLK
ncbi:ribosomal RNA small subunit methyltransferase G [Clostridium pasteurianum DSM 525 = ATCC 6013]|uniref:Ribosomal RNA small subunit methyltransferase G n=1 Tax=Clostridium pasteurianum DSM 525 = ATCC 6013 TaxID=1262449 RepID=A0A0H3J8C5_CLOPA|nr:16S rRNA (guanine(527)-N(7))-methyltransferase RsmG [Clostridium pasteurianum]AJA50121.1 ribosomal RNA small subunit methyltransferase G [Clostridium pasteurianum DSM 525 = ATCC 6013]AJA54109.1 ribosomal RNA small subunit methyltransferase G [Clostridium pasteurianum DSM 525 = ATCC 6013]AOZ77235.1 16S rRNA (guanine(527)-N(7))-methyltransferase RsmG [Clostridium pasteurianum DSM 525 = ATCC 6013]AOZ81031.1 16S rRNA (guanine(527)-N(7))-methyltransferase RsmG [Clostridium pasteurianum]ELP59180.